MKKNNNPLENFIMVVILLVMVQTLLDDLSVLMDWTWSARKVLLITGFCFDVFFSLEFFIRFFNAINKGRGGVKQYFLRERGWIDLAASVPLLLLSSGPAFFSLFTGMVIGGFAGVLNVLKVVKAVRIARVLRLLRVLKIFKQIKFTDSVMVQRHSAKIVTTAVASVILSVTIMSILFSIISIKDVEDHYNHSHLSMAQYIAHNQELLNNPEE
jgi:hypothetical protein